MKKKKQQVDFSEEVILKERPRTRLKRAFFSFFVLVVLVGVVYLSTPLSRLGVVSFEGLVTVNRSELISLIDVEEDDWFLLLNLSEIRREVEAHPVIREVRVSRMWLNRLHIEVLEYQVAACALIEDDWYHILDDGTVVHESAGLRANCDEWMIHGLTAEELEAGIPTLFVQQLVEVDPEVRNLIQMIEYAPLYGDQHRFSLFMADGNTVKVRSHTMVERLNRYFELLSHIDVDQRGVFHMDIGGMTIPFIPY